MIVFNQWKNVTLDTEFVIHEIVVERIKAVRKMKFAKRYRITKFACHQSPVSKMVVVHLCMTATQRDCVFRDEGVKIGKNVVERNSE